MLASEIQERINKRRLLILCTLIVCTIGSVFLLRSTNRVTVNKEQFRDIDFESVDHVRILTPSDTIELTFQNSRWMLNDQFAADRKYITLLFATLKQAEPKREVSPDLRDSVDLFFQKAQTKVTLYSGNNVLKEFSSSGNDNQTQTFFKDSATGKIYLMSIPGYRVYVGGIFEMNSGSWRDKMILGAFNWRNFASLETTFPGKPSENYKIKVEGPGLLGVDGVKTDTAKLNAFMYDLSVVSVDDYPESSVLRDSLSKATPFMTMTLTDIGNRQQTLRIFREDKNRVYGLISGHEVVVFNPQRIRSIVRPKSFFKLN